MKVMDAQISRLEERLRQLKAQKLRVDARHRSLASRRARKDDTRRKILVGGDRAGQGRSGCAGRVRTSELARCGTDACG